MSHSRALDLALIGTIGAFGLAACKHPEAADIRQRQVIVQAAIAEPAGVVGRIFTGVVAARVQSDLGFRVQGKIVSRLVDTGQIVRRGQALMRIDPTDYAHAVTVQSGDVASARARWIQADADEKRYRGLVTSGAISRLVYDDAKAAADSAKALLAAGEAQEKVARNQGDYALLLADSDGTIVETLAEPGQVVAAGQTVIRLAHAGPREASIDLPETIRPPLLSVASATLFGGQAHVTARLRQLSDSADPRTRTYEARYVLQGDGATAPLGATVKVTLDGGSGSQSLQVPSGAIDDEGRGPGVWIIKGEPATVSYRPVEVEAIGDEAATLRSGLKAGERIVAAGGHFLHEGQHVRVIDNKVAMQ